MTTPSPFPSDPYAEQLGPVLARDLVRTFATSRAVQRVLDGLDLTAAPGERVGLLGENGSGKSTLLRILAGVDLPDSGALQVPSDLVYLPQEPSTPPGGTVGDLLEEALRPHRQAVLDLEQLATQLTDRPESAAAFDRVLAWATLHDAWDADRRALVTAAALGVGDLDRQRPLGTLSGGQRSRLALAAALVRRPAVLLLDEPTNHLDDQALAALEEALVALPGVVVAASHDRTFLDHVCTSLFDLDAGALGSDGRGGATFGGNFTEYLAHRDASRRRWEETYRAQQEEITRLRAQTRITTAAIAHHRGPRDNDKFIHHFKGGNVERAQARRVHDAQRRLDEAEQHQLRKPPRPLTFAGFAPVATAAGPVVAVRGLRVDGVDGPRVRVDELVLSHGEHLLVTGANGSGKSTLLGVLAGQVRADAGSVSVRARRTALLAQDPSFARPEVSAARTYVESVGAEVAERTPLGSLGLLAPRDRSKPVAELSVGQQRRLSLAIAVGTGPDLLLLDEPSNHLSLALVSELEEALRASAATVLVTSHDRWLRQRWNARIHALGSF